MVLRATKAVDLHGYKEKKNPQRTLEGQSNLTGKVRRRCAAPFLSIRCAPVGASDEEQKPHEAKENEPLGGKGRHREPLDGGAFTVEVPAHTGKGVSGGQRFRLAPQGAGEVQPRLSLSRSRCR